MCSCFAGECSKVGGRRLVVQFSRAYGYARAANGAERSRTRATTGVESVGERGAHKRASRVSWTTLLAQMAHFSPVITIVRAEAFVTSMAGRLQPVFPGHLKQDRLFLSFHIAIPIASDIYFFFRNFSPALIRPRDSFCNAFVIIISIIYEFYGRNINHFKSCYILFIFAFFYAGKN